MPPANQSNSRSIPRLPIRIGHLSDIHFGRISDPGIVEDLYTDLHKLSIDLLVVSGDLTQRAFPRQYRAAAEFLARMEMPWLAVPGNHDVFPWWRPILRLRNPLRRYRKWIIDDINPRIDWPNIAVLGINSAYGSTIQGGRIDSSQLKEMESFFSIVSSKSFKILVVHHHLTRLDALLNHDIATGAQKTLQCVAELNIDMVLCGHLHISHVAHLENIGLGRSLIVSTAGTSTSDRGRGTNESRNFYNLITLSSDEVMVEEREHDPSCRSFRSASCAEYSRQGIT